MSDRRIDITDWVPADEWARAPRAIRDRWLALVAEDVQTAMRRQIIAGIGRDGKRLRRLMPGSRPDGTRDRPLTPHDDASRSTRLLKVQWRSGRLSLLVTWSYWTRIVQYHAAGIPSRIGPIVRDITGLSGPYRRAAKGRALALWQRTWPYRSEANLGRLVASPR